MEDLNQYLVIAQEKAIELGLNLLAAIVIFVIGRWATKLITRLVKRIMARKKLT